MLPAKPLWAQTLLELHVAVAGAVAWSPKAEKTLLHSIMLQLMPILQVEDQNSVKVSYLTA